MPDNPDDETAQRMRERITARLDQLRGEFEAGQDQLRRLVAQETALRETLLRISGAIQVLEELEGQTAAEVFGGRPGASAGSPSAVAIDGVDDSMILSVP